MIGDLKHRITLQKSIRVADGGGGFTESWEDAVSVYASIVPLSGSEQLRQHQLEASVTHRITIRHRSDVNTALRIVKGAAIYDIAAVTDKDGLGIWLEILAVEKTF